MTLGFGRVIPAPPEEDATTASRRAAPAPALGRVAPEVIVQASERAREIVARAEREAKTIVERAEQLAAELAAELGARARTEAATALAAREIAVAAREANHVERELDRVVELARLLAERLLGEALRLDPTRVAALARQALTEVRGARQLTLAAHPDDVPLLERAVAEQALAPLRIVADASRPRSSVRLDTELGTLDADLAPQLDLLAQKLREALSHA